MRIAKIRIFNILGIEEIELEAGKFNVIRGGNDKGKTSILKAIKAALKGGKDATLLRDGAEAGEIVLELNDGTTIKKRVRQKTQVTKIDKFGVEEQHPAEALARITDALSVNPVEFITADEKNRVNTLLDALALSVDYDAIEERIKRKIDRRIVPASVTNALDAIQIIRQSIFDDRTGTNRAIKEKNSTINQLAATLPTNAAGDATPALDEAGLLAEVNRIDADRDTEMDRIAAKLEKFRSECDQEIQDITTDLYETIDAHKAEIDRLQACIRKEHEAASAAIAAIKNKLSGISSKAEQQKTITAQNHAAARSGVDADLKLIQATRDAATRAATTRETMQTLRAEADQLQVDADQQTNALKALDDYKTELLESLPIPGLAVVGGKIFRNRIPFDSLNTAQQIEIAVEIAKIRAGDLGVICVDRIESLDGKRLDELRRQVLASGLQMFVTRVTDADTDIVIENYN